MFKKYKSTLKNEVFFNSFVSVMLISTLFITFLALTMYKMNLEIAYQRLQKDNTYMATYTEGVFDTLAMSTEVLLEFMELYDYEQDYDATKRNIIKLLVATGEANENIVDCYIGLERDGMLLDNNDAPPGYDARVRPWYTEALKSPDKVVISPPYQDIKTKDWVISLSKPIIDGEGVLKGVAAVDFNLEFASELMLKKGFYETQTNYMINKDGTVFIHPNQSYSNRQANEIVPGLSDLFTSDSGFIAYRLNDLNRIAYYTKLEYSEWIIVSAIDSSELVMPVIKRSVLMVLGLLGLAMVLGFIQMKLFERSFVKPIIALKNRITAITTGIKIKQLDNPFSNKELAEISNKIEEMAEHSLREKADQLALILSSTSDGLLVLDLEGKVIHANNQFMEMWSLTEASDLSKFTNPVLIEQLALFQNLQQKSLSNIVLPNGIVIEQNYQPVIDNNIMAGRLWSYRDVTERVQAEEALKLMATTDALTGVWNRRHFMTQGQREFELLKRTDLPLSVIFIDVDRFKLLNDTFGHSTGDEALKYLAKSILNLIRSTDLFARLGGEEFCILAPNTSLEAACIVAEKLRSFFESNNLLFNGQNIPFTLSLGVSCCESDDLTFDKLIEYADASCYEAKTLGRNRVVAYGSGGSNTTG